VNGHREGYLTAVIPDDTAGQPLTPGEQAAIADLERRFLLDAAAPGHDHPFVTRPTRLGRTRRRTIGRSTAAVPLVALFVTAVVLVALVIVVGAGVLGAAAVLLSVVATALVWPLVPARFGGPVRSPRRPVRSRGPVRRRS
jgi:hypothetical protein